MIDSDSVSKQEGTKLHIIIAFARTDEMTSRRNEHSSGSTSCTSDGPPRRRALPIEDLLNPSVEDRNTGPTSLAPIRASSSGISGSSGLRYYQNKTTTGRRRPQCKAPRSPRGSPTGSSSSRYSGTRREFRPTYSEEETLFIWYHRIDLKYDWPDIINAYNAQFPDRVREGPGGIQCRYYRCCSDNNIPKVRDRRRSASSVKDYGMRARTGLVYPWMKH